nr:hypothetical protein [Candidatus Sigynarchaeota archaeon]
MSEESDDAKYGFTPTPNHEKSTLVLKNGVKYNRKNGRLWPVACVGCGETNPSKLTSAAYKWTPTTMTGMTSGTKVEGNKTYNTYTYSYKSGGTFDLDFWLCPTCKDAAKRSLGAGIVVFIVIIGGFIAILATLGGSGGGLFGGLAGIMVTFVFMLIFVANRAREPSRAFQSVRNVDMYPSYRFKNKKYAQLFREGAGH